MPKLWTNTMAAHRQNVQDAILDATASLTLEHGVRAVTMAQIAEAAGIGRATLYKYYTDIESILVEWHARQVAECLATMRGITSVEPRERLRGVLAAFAAAVTKGRRFTDLIEFLRHTPEFSTVRDELVMMVTDIIREAAAQGVVRRDVPPDELALYALQAVKSLGKMSDPGAKDRILQVTMDGLVPRAV